MGLRFRYNSIDREILRLSLPTIVSNVTVPLLGICDTAIAGHLGSELFLSAIAVGSVMLNVVFWIFGFLRGGTTGLTANALGEENTSEIGKVFYRSLSIAFAAGFLLIIFQTPIYKALISIVGASEEIREDVLQYFRLRIWGAPALLATMAISGWFVGMQSTYYPMLIAIVMNLLNIAGSFILVFPLHYGFAGVAAGTMISNWLGLLISIGCILYFLKGRFPKVSIAEFLKGNWWRYFSVNGNLFIRSFFIICVTMGVTAAGATLGNLTLAVNVIIMQFFQFFSFFMDGFAFSGEAMVGLRYGEKNFTMLNKSVRRLLQWTFATGIFFTIFYSMGTPAITSLLTDSPGVREGVGEMILWISLIPLVSCWAFIFDGFYIGITDTFNMMISSLAGALIFFFIIYASPALLSAGGNSLIWIAFLSYLGLRGAYLALCWRRKIIGPDLRKSII